jgi:hypothetical protein
VRFDLAIGFDRALAHTVDPSRAAASSLGEPFGLRSKKIKNPLDK